MPLNLFYTMVQKSQKWPKTQIKGGGGPALKEKITALQNRELWSDRFLFRWFRWWRSEVKIRTGRRSNRKRKNGMCEQFWRQLCNLAIMQSQGSDWKCSWSARITS